eukprot:TRINITY_DN31438_c0_g1_i1.p1 TRINITY_DN31438_c0_g1~~TRINITY_DN31438_c0_g1_i1.p1  ORF type:complete len:622 (+),score=137.86 TRINITY_DN31438_c0_g1_i1:214-1866(+)
MAAMSARGRLLAAGSHFEALVGLWNRSGVLVEVSQRGSAWELSRSQSSAAGRRGRGHGLDLGAVGGRRFAVARLSSGAFLLRGADGWSWEKWSPAGLALAEVEVWDGGRPPTQLTTARWLRGPVDDADSGGCAAAEADAEAQSTAASAPLTASPPAQAPSKAAAPAALPPWLQRFLRWREAPEVMAAIRSLQEDCSRCSVAMRFSAGNGLAAKLQLAASQLAKHWGQCQPVRLVGHFGVYSNHSLCAGKGAGCLLEALESCPQRGTRRPCAVAALAGAGASCELGRLIADRGFAWAFAAAQRYLLRPAKALWPTLAVLALKAGLVGAYGDGPAVAMHVRRGDKVTEVGHYHTYIPTDAYIREAVAHAFGSNGVCRHGKRGTLDKVPALQSAEPAGDAASAAQCVVLVASDAEVVFREVELAFKKAAGGRGRVVVLGLRGSATQAASGVGLQLGALANAGSPELAADLASEVLFDILALASARGVIVATVASQVGRVAAGIAHAPEDGQAPAKLVALDHFQLHHVRRMFAKYPVPVQEPWASPLTLGHVHA